LTNGSLSVHLLGQFSVSLNVISLGLDFVLNSDFIWNVSADVNLFFNEKYEKWIKAASTDLNFITKIKLCV